MVTPPFTQLNTPYPATSYLKGFLNTRGITSFQADLGIEVFLEVFSRNGLKAVFDIAQGKTNDASMPTEVRRMLILRDTYIAVAGPVVRFLQGKDHTLAHRIAADGFLPHGLRFAQTADMEGVFGKMGIQDKAKYRATMFLEDVNDLIRDWVDPYFGFTRYAEKLGRSAGCFDELYSALQSELTFTDNLLVANLQRKMDAYRPQLLALSVPFPGNLYAALRCAQWVKAHAPATKVALGGGFANTELRSLSDNRLFEIVDFVCLDDGEAPLETLVHLCNGSRTVADLKRTFYTDGQNAVYTDNAACGDYRPADAGTPDYSDLLLNDYVSAIEVVNPMHSLWSDGRWNKLTMAHGCYWAKCTFCDISLDYIKTYSPLTATAICDRMEQVMAQTGNTGFHFVDEAAPPALMKAVAIEILRREMVVSWWTNIRFEKSFTRDLCMLLKASGCIAVSGGLEVASDRLLALINKGVTVAQVAAVNKHFTEAGIMVHAYLMYGFPTQTDQETIDALEVVRQMVQEGIMQSGYWHLFTMTAHSPVGLAPEQFKVADETPAFEGFARNDLLHNDPAGADHAAYGEGLRKAMFNYMHGNCLDFPLHKWFDFKTPKTTIPRDYVATLLRTEGLPVLGDHMRVVWTGRVGGAEVVTKSKGGNTWSSLVLNLIGEAGMTTIRVDKDKGEWLIGVLRDLEAGKTYTIKGLRESFEAAGLDDFELFWENKPINGLWKAGLVCV